MELAFAPEQQDKVRIVGLTLAMFMRIALLFAATWIIGPTAVGMVDELWIMVAAVVIAIALMLFTAKAISDFVTRHPTVKMLALAFLVLIGATLIAEGFDVHIDKALIYGPIAFAIGVEALNLVYRRRLAAKRETSAAPVQLRPTLVKDPVPDQITPVPVGAERHARRSSSTPEAMNHPDGAP